MSPDVQLAGFLALVVLVTAAGVLLHRRKRTRVRADRGRLFDHAARLFTDVTVTQDDVGFPVLTGKRGGHTWRLEPVVDAVTYRKLPVLWLCVTCYADLDVPAPLSVLLRPTGNEFFSANARYRHEVPLPGGCPAHARAATSAPQGVGLALGPAADLLGEQATKEVLLSGRGMRVVRQVAEAESGRYRVGRRIDLGAPVLDADGLARVCDVVAAAVGEREAVSSW